MEVANVSTHAECEGGRVEVFVLPRPPPPASSLSTFFCSPLHVISSVLEVSSARHKRSAKELEFASEKMVTPI